MLKLDLHTHSVASSDGGITEKEYIEIITKNVLDFVAITDHNRIDFAQKMQEKLGENIVIGEEIMTRLGEVIGLFLNQKIEAGLSLNATISAIHKQGGLVYIPHPFDKFRHGIGKKNLLRHKQKIDIIEGFNGRIVWRDQNTKAWEFALSHKIISGLGSDAHNIHGIGKTYAKINNSFTKESAKKVLREAEFVMCYQPWFEYLRPKLNRFKKRFRI